MHSGIYVLTFTLGCGMERDHDAAATVTAGRPLNRDSSARTGKVGQHMIGDVGGDLGHPARIA